MKTLLSTGSAEMQRGEAVWVAAVGLINADGRVLMQRRPAQGEHGDLWEFPGGKLEHAESPEDAAVRELAEELGIAVEAGDLEPVSFASRQHDAGTPGRALTILLFACRRWRGDPQPLAASELAWHWPPELTDLRMPPLDYPLAAALAAFLEREGER